MAANETHRGKRVLVIDDNQVIQKALSSVLKLNGFEVASALDGSEVIARLHEHRPDVILLDIMFPPNVAQGGAVWEGFNILNWLRIMGHAGKIPFIVISGANPDKNRRRSLAAGASAYFSKPLPMRELIEAIHAALDRPAQNVRETDVDEMPELHVIAA
jgi:two-component system response regulator PrrA